jgi:hypothetical protein
LRSSVTKSLRSFTNGLNFRTFTRYILFLLIRKLGVLIPKTPLPEPEEILCRKIFCCKFPNFPNSLVWEFRPRCFLVAGHPP